MIQQPKILIINPNTSLPISQLIGQLAVDDLSGSATVHIVTARFGASYIGSRASVAIAGHAVLDAYAEAGQSGEDYAAVVIACFGDPGIEALRDICPAPVIGFAEASMLFASQSPGRFAIATIGAAWSDMLSELAQRLQLADRLAGFIPLAESSRQTGVPGATLIAAATALGAQRIIIGGTGLIPAIPGIVGDTAFPVIDAHRTALQMALVQATSGQAHQALAQVPGPDYVGLAPALTGLLVGRHG